MANDSVVREAKFVDLSDDAKHTWVELWKAFYAARREMFKMMAREEPSHWAWPDMADQQQERLDLLMDRGEQHFDWVTPWFTDGELATHYYYDERFVFFTDGKPEAWSVDDPSLIYYWDGNAWYGDDQRMFEVGLRPLTEEMRIITRALVTGYDPGTNPNAQLVSAQMSDASDTTSKKPSGQN